MYNTCCYIGIVSFLQKLAGTPATSYTYTYLCYFQRGPLLTDELQQLLMEGGASLTPPLLSPSSTSLLLTGSFTHLSAMILAGSWWLLWLRLSFTGVRSSSTLTSTDNSSSRNSCFPSSDRWKA